MDLDRNALISGDIIETFCVNCNKKIKIYAISLIKKPFDEEGAISAIEKLSLSKLQ